MVTVQQALRSGTLSAEDLAFAFGFLARRRVLEVASNAFFGNGWDATSKPYQGIVAEYREPKKLVLEVFRGGVEAVTADAIVRATDPSLRAADNTPALVSQNVWKAVKAQAPLGPGEAVVGPALVLKSRNLIHAAITDAAHKRDDRVFVIAVQSALREADRLGARSIAIPPLGHSFLGLPFPEVARLLVAAVEQYQRVQWTGLEKVKLVAPYPDLASALEGEITQSARQTPEEIQTATLEAVRLAIREMDLGHRAISNAPESVDAQLARRLLAYSWYREPRVRQRFIEIVTPLLARHRILVDRVLELKSDPDDDVRNAAQKALASNGKKKATKVEESMASDDSIRFGPIEVILAEGFVYQFEADGYVAGTTPDLDMTIGVSGALARVVGRRALDQDLMPFRSGERPKPGDVIVTNAGSLGVPEGVRVFGFRKILHSVITDVDYVPDDVVVKGTTMNALRTADAANPPMRSLVFPALGTGMPRMKNEESARILFAALRDYAQEHPETNIRKVTLVPMGNLAARIFHSEFRKLYRKPKPSSALLGTFPHALLGGALAAAFGAVFAGGDGLFPSILGAVFSGIVLNYVVHESGHALAGLWEGQKVRWVREGWDIGIRFSRGRTVFNTAAGPLAGGLAATLLWAMAPISSAPLHVVALTLLSINSLSALFKTPGSDAEIIRPALRDYLKSA